MNSFCLVSIACRDLERNVLFKEIVKSHSQYCSDYEYKFLGRDRNVAFSPPHDLRYVFITPKEESEYLKNLLLLGINDAFVYSEPMPRIAQISELLKEPLIHYMRSLTAIGRMPKASSLQSRAEPMKKEVKIKQ